MNNFFLYLSIRFSILFRRYNSGFILLFAIIFTYLLDYCFFQILRNNLIPLTSVQSQIVRDSQILIAFAPEAWLSLLGLVLGTLIIVISVASQSTPKLIDLYTNDQISLAYIWYIIIGSVHNFFLQLYTGELEKKDLHEISSMLLNTYIMLPIALMMAVPYVLYILRYTKTSNVIDKIYTDNLKRIKRLSQLSKISRLHDKKTIAQYQFDLFISLNQLDDLLEYVSFKEPKGDILNKISLSIQKYISIKKDLNDIFFKISHKIGNDVSFKTMTGQFEEMEKSRTFYEQKGFRLFGNAYQKLMESEDFDLASVCAFELSECGRAAIEHEDEALAEVVLIRFNTLLRFGIKHGLKNKEARNLYNAIFHYSGFIHHIIRAKNEKFIRLSCRYLNIYVNEIFQHSRSEPSFGFLVDVFTWEFKRILLELNLNGLPIELQKDILGLFLKIDNLADVTDDPAQKGKTYSMGVRGFQISLALFYLSTENESLAESIIIDILSDHEFMDKETLRGKVTTTCERLATASPRFWEDTDRGNSNLYFSKEKDYIPGFMKLFESMLETYSLLGRRK